MPLTSPDILTYNGWTFPSAFTKTKVTFRPDPDSAGRTITKTVVTVHATTYVTEGANQDATLETIRAALTVQGGHLKIANKGLGEFEINGPAGRRDLRWGPIPKILEWETVGGASAARVTWQCEACLLECEDAAWAGQIMEYCYSLDISTDKGGYSTRVYSGSLTIPATRSGVNNRRPPDTADAYFERAIPDPLPNFERTIQRSLSEDKRTLKFTVTDTERPGNPLPEGMVEARFSHTVATEGGAKGAVFLKWGGTMTAEYEMAKGVPRTKAVEYFLKKIAKDRIAADRAAGWWYMPIALSMSEPDVHGRSGAAFSFTYSLIWDEKSATMRYRYPTAGLWRNAPSDWNRWHASLAGTARAARGVAGLGHLAQDDVIVDLCLNQGNVVRGGGGARLKGRFNDGGIIPFGGEQFNWDEVAQILGVPYDVSPIGSWLTYECRLVVEPVDRYVVHKPLPVAPAPSVVAFGQSTAAIQSLFSSPKHSFYAAPQTSPQTIVQNCGGTDFYLRLVGRALRVGHEIPPPTLLGVGNCPVIPMNHPRHGTYFATWTAGYTTHPIQASEFNLRWFVQLPAGAAGINVASPPRPDQPANAYRGTVR